MHALAPLTFVALKHLRHLPALQVPYIHIAVLRAADYVLPTRQREGVGDGVLLVFVPPVYTPYPTQQVRAGSRNADMDTEPLTCMSSGTWRGS